MTPEQFGNFIKDLYRPYLNFLRFGQHAFNMLYRHDPILADKIRGTKFDPFYNDEKFPDFINKVVDSIDYGDNKVVAQMSEKESQPCPTSIHLYTE